MYDVEALLKKAKEELSEEEKAIDEKLEALANEISALTPEELETLEIMLDPELMAELLIRSKEAREHPETLLTHEEVFGRPIEDVIQRKIYERSKERYSKTCASS